MGKGDTRTRRGKIFNRSYGKSRRRAGAEGAPTGATKPKAKKTTAK